MRAPQWLIASTALIVSLAAGGSVAIAHTVEYSAKVTINDNSGVTRASGAAARNYTFEFFGKVKSEKGACEGARAVVLIDLNADNENEDPPAVVGEDETDDQGAWLISNSSKPDADLYRAKAKKKVLRRGNGHKHVCAAARSRTYFFFPF